MGERFTSKIFFPIPEPPGFVVGIGVVSQVIFRFFADRAIDLFFNKRSTARAEETHEVGATLLSAEMQLMRIE